jgi:hypothetical protein
MLANELKVTCLERENSAHHVEQDHFVAQSLCRKSSTRMPLVGPSRLIVDHLEVVLLLVVARTDRRVGSDYTPAVGFARPTALLMAMDIVFAHIHST